MLTSLHAPGNRTVCKKEELFCFLFLNTVIQLNKVIKVIERSKWIHYDVCLKKKHWHESECTYRKGC